MCADTPARRGAAVRSFAALPFAPPKDWRMACRTPASARARARGRPRSPLAAVLNRPFSATVARSKPEALLTQKGVESEGSDRGTELDL